MEKTFSIIKPDAVKAGNAGAILSRKTHAHATITDPGIRATTTDRSPSSQ